MSKRVHTRKAQVLATGHVAHAARIWAKGADAEYDWRCVCKPEDGHDHDALHEKIAERLVHRHRALPGLQALVGFSERRGLVRYEICDANIQITGPARWVLYVAWWEYPLTHPEEKRHDSFSIPYECPSACLTPDQILERVRASVDARGHGLAQSLKAAGRFMTS